MKNAMQLKGIMKKISKAKNISAQLVLQNYMLERLLERIFLSKYKDNFILKGGFLIASIVGLDSRSTMDMDVTLKSLPLNHDLIKKVFLEIINISIEDNISFEFGSLVEIREKDEYTGYRISLTGRIYSILVPLKLDITTGDIITPKEIEFEYKTLLDQRTIPVLAYNLETILAEKLETIISRGDQTTRPRDYYDVYILRKLQNQNVSIKDLNDALLQTAYKRSSIDIIKSYKDIVQTIKSSKAMQSQWEKYQRSFDYSKDIDFIDICDVVIEIMNELEI